MKPQERHNAIWASKCDVTMKVVLLAFASHLGDDERSVCWPSPERLAELTSLAESTVKATIATAVKQGLLRRWSGGHRAKDTELCWEAIAAVQAAPPSRRGGKRQGSDVRTPAQGSDVRMEGSDVRTPAVRSSDPRGPATGPEPDMNRTGNRPAKNPPAPLPGGEVAVQRPGRARSVEQLWTLEHQRVWARYLELHPLAGLEGGACPPGDARVIRRELAVWGADPLLAVLDWVHESLEWYPGFLRGENPGSDGRRQAYLGLADIFSADKIAKRVGAARVWIEGRRVEVESRPDDGAEDLALECGGKLSGWDVRRLREEDWTDDSIRDAFNVPRRSHAAAPA